MMLKNLVLILFISTSCYLSAQTSTEKDLELIESPEQIDSYLEKSKKNKLITFNQERHKTILARDLFGLSKGGVKKIKNEYNQTFYKVIEKTEKKYYRVSFIALDGKEITPYKISELQDKIIQEFNNGAPFDFLAKRYSIDQNAKQGGDTGWFSEDENNNEFETIIINDTHGLNDIFTIDKTLKKESYIVLKTYEPKNISEIEVLKIVEPLN